MDATAKGTERIQEDRLMIYISGKITGDTSFREKFRAAEKCLTILHPEETILNPAEITLPACCEWDDYMHICLKLLDRADKLYLLEDWRESPGACVEYGYALAKGITVINQAEINRKAQTDMRI